MNSINNNKNICDRNYECENCINYIKGTIPVKGYIKSGCFFDKFTCFTK